MPGLLFIEKSKLLDTQEESGVVLHVEEGGPLEERTGTVTECGEHGNRKKMNPRDKKIGKILKQDEFKKHCSAH